MKFTDIRKSSLCMGCGVCTALNGKPSLIEKNGINQPDFLDLDKSGKFTPEYCCPAVKPDLNELSKYKFEKSLSSNNLDIGIYNKIYLASSNNKEILQKSSSGGVITEIALYLLENKLVDGVICQIMEYSTSGPRPKSVIARNKKDLIKAQGSKYCPTNIEHALFEAISNSSKSYCLIGLPCQINAVLKAEKSGLIKKGLIKYTIGNFCGGFKDYRELDDLIVRNGKEISNIKHFQFRGDGQPGFLQISDGKTNDIKIKYPQYGAGSYVNKFDRCTLCIDATALLADFACGDAWLDEKSKKIKLI
jgi:coenzyme F420 hydrogenase subunit beta